MGVALCSVRRMSVLLVVKLNLKRELGSLAHEGCHGCWGCQPAAKGCVQGRRHGAMPVSQLPWFSLNSGFL